jgi:hypothetical protein
LARATLDCNFVWAAKMRSGVRQMFAQMAPAGLAGSCFVPRPDRDDAIGLESSYGTIA